MARPVILLAGIPGSGKSSFAEWLAREKGFIHVDMEKDGLDKHGFREHWERFCNDTTSSDFVGVLLKHSNPIALDWGFPVHCLNIVASLQKQGIVLWWFTGDRLHTRNYFEARGTIPPVAFDNQYASISASWTKIAPVFGSNVVRTVRTDGTHASNEEIYKQIIKDEDKDLTNSSSRRSLRSRHRKDGS
jgi:hypothetical protein